MAVVAAGPALRGRRLADQVDRARLLLPHCGARACLAAATSLAGSMVASTKPCGGGAALSGVGGWCRQPGRLACPVRHRTAGSAAAPLSPAPFTALPLARDRHLSA